MEKYNRIKEWEKTINKMSYKELQISLTDPSYYPEFKELAKKRLAELDSIEEKENIQTATREVLLKALRKRRCKYELIEDDDKVIISYNRRKFCADICCEDDFIILFFTHNILIKEEDEAKLSKLKRVLNATNQICDVNTVYDRFEETGDIYVYSKTTIYYVSENPNFIHELYLALEGCLTAQYAVKVFMKRKCKR